MKRKIGCFIRLKNKFALLVTLHDVGYVTTWQTSFLGHVNVEHYHPLNNINTLGQWPNRRFRNGASRKGFQSSSTSDREAFETSSDGKAGTGSFLITRDVDLSQPLDAYYHLSGSAVDEEAVGIEEVVLTLGNIVCIAIFPPQVISPSLLGFTRVL